MTRNVLLLWVAFTVLPACSLQRGAIVCSEGTAYEPGSLCAPLDSDVDGSLVDGGMPDDGDVPTDTGVDAWVPDGDAGPLEDAGTDAGTDSGPDPIDGGDPRRCEDTTDGICILFENIAGSPEVTGWMIQFYWTVTGGGIYRLPDNRSPEGDPIFAPACDVLRRIDARTTECEITIPDPGRVTIGTGPFYAYPTYASGPACSSTGCPAYDAGYRMWINGTEYSTAPADGRMSQESRPTTAGAIVVLRITPP